MQTIIPYLVVKNAPAAIDFYKAAFGAEEKFRMAGPDGVKLIHAQLLFGESLVFLSDDFLDHPSSCKSPATLGGTSVTIHMVSRDVDKTVATAVAAGATVTMPVADMFWGDRYGRIVDPFGHMWSISTPKEKLTPDQMNAAAKTFFSKMNQQQQQQ
jgi:PhnB protein